MFDRRVVRGITHAIYSSTTTKLSNSLDNNRKLQKLRQINSLVAPSKFSSSFRSSSKKIEPDCPEAAHTNLEVIGAFSSEEKTETPEEKAIYVRNAKFAPVPLGDDCATQVVDSDLFVFDLAVEPLLEVLVGVCLSQSKCDVSSEENRKLSVLKEEKWQLVRNAELNTVQRIDSRHTRLEKEKSFATADQSLREKKIILDSKEGISKEVSKKVLSNVQFKGVVAAAEHLYNPLVRELESDFFPWLSERTFENIRRTKSFTILVDELLDELTTDVAGNLSVFEVM